MEIWLIRSTFAKKDEAISVARTLLEEKLIACANIMDSVTSIYHWEDLIQQEDEVVLVVKTTERRVQQTLERIRTLHHYQIPSIMAWPVAKADGRFADWIASETA